MSRRHSRQNTRRSFAPVIAVLCSSLLFSAPLLAQTPPSPPAPAAATQPRTVTADDTKHIQDAKTARDTADTAIQNAKMTLEGSRDRFNRGNTLLGSLQSYILQITDGGIIQTSDEAEFRQIGKLIKALKQAKMDDKVMPKSIQDAEMVLTGVVADIGALIKNDSNLNKASAQLDMAISALGDEKASDIPQIVKQAIVDTKAMKQAVTDLLQRSKNDSAAAQKLKDDIAKTNTDFTKKEDVTATIKDRSDKLQSRIAIVKGLSLDSPENLASKLPGSFDILAAVADQWKALADLTKAAGSDSTASAYKTLDTDYRDSVRNSAPWLAALEKYAKTEALNLGQQREQLLSDPIKNQESASRVIASDRVLISNLVEIGKGAIALDAKLSLLDITGDPIKTDIDNLKGRLTTFQDQVERLKGAASRLQESLEGNIEDFVADQISLFYFTDIPRLMRVLNDETRQEGGSVQAQARASSARQELTVADLALQNAQIEVNNTQRRVQTIQESLRQAQAGFNASDGLMMTLNRRLAAAQDKQIAVQRRLTNANTAAATDPNNPLKQAAAEAAQKAKDASEIDVQKATEKQSDAQKNRDANKTTLDDLQSEKNDLPAKLKEAQDKLETAKADANRLRREAILAAQADVEAFAAARDNAPFYVASGTAASTDPAKRIRMYAFQDSKTIFLRGKRADVDSVKEIISKFDQPTPQARLTLWTLELNSEASFRGAQKFNEALKIVEAQLSESRAQIAAAVSLLRDCINEEVGKIAVAANEPLSVNAEYEKRLTFYSQDIRGIDTRRLLRGAGFDLPDPAATTTLGEALMVLSLADATHAKNVIKRFSDLLQSPHMFQKVISDGEGADLADRLTRERKQLRFPSPGQGVWFASLRRALGILPDNNESLSQGLRPAQIEIKRALVRVAQQRLSIQLSDEIKRLEQLDTENSAIDKKRQDPKNTQPDKDRMDSAQFANNLEQSNIKDQVIKAINWLQFKLPQINEYSGLLNTTLEDTPATIKALLAIQNIIRQNIPTETTNARIAAADQMLKELIIAMEDDLDRYFVTPMLNDLRSDLLRKQVGVGVLQRTSVLASNRLIARVDPRASGQAEVGQDTNILQAAQQLSQLYLTAQTAGLTGVLGGLNALPKDAPPALYGITTGSVFQVTPIIDPSGQALRFRFDYVSASQIREPNETIDPALPRIERHSVNTEVQLSSLELRNVSQYDSNVRLGIPTRYGGGIPILKDIPVLRDIPLIGWFSKHSGRAALTQQSLIFAQTAIYPTIGDISNLLLGEVNVDKVDNVKN